MKYCANSLFHRPQMGFKKVWLGIAFAVTTSSYSQLSLAQLTFNGELRTVTPQVSISNSDRPVANVKDFLLEVQRDAVECDLLTDAGAADNTFLAGARPLCLFEWTGLVNGVEADNLLVSGVLEESETVSFSYQISILDRGERDVILQDVYTVDVASPIVPEILEVITNWNDGNVPGLEQENYERDRAIIGARIEVEPRPFIQRLRFQDGECDVDVDDTSCDLIISPVVPGGGEPEATGLLVDSVEALDTKDFLTPNAVAVAVDYDYRSPEVVDFIVNGVGEMRPISYSVENQDFVVGENEALLVLRTPHADKEGDWWIPRVGQIRLQISDNINSSRSIVVDGLEIEFPVNTFIPDQLYRIREQGEPVMLVEHVVIRYDISSLPDAEYIAQIEATDEYDNSRMQSNPGQIVDRSGPAIVGLVDDQVISSGGRPELYFQGELLFAAHGGWEDGSRITNVTRDSQPIEFDVVNPQVIRLRNDPNIPRETEVTYKIEGVDGAGNVSSEEFTLNHNPAFFSIAGLDDQVFRAVQPLDVNLFQRRGARCVLSATAETASLLSTAFSKGCTIEFDNLPAGLSIVDRGRFLKVVGGLDEVGEQTIDYRVVFHNRAGDSTEVFSDSFTVNVAESPPIRINLTDINKISDGLYSVPVNSEDITRAEFLSANGDVLVEVEAGGRSYDRLLPGNSRFAELNRRYTLRRVEVDGNDLWERKEYTVSARYLDIDNSLVEDTFDVVVTPHSQTSSFVDISHTPSVTTEETVDVTLRVGFFNRREDVYTYDPSIMGDWEVQLNALSGRELTPIGDFRPIDGNGTVSFSEDAQMLFDAGTSFVAVARSVGGIEGFEQQLVSRPQLVRVLKGTGVEGELSNVDVSEQVPFRGLLTFRYASRADVDVVGDIIWQRSTDGVNFEDIEGQVETRLIVDTNEPGESFYRLKLNNRFTDVVSYSQTARFVGYELREFEIVGPARLLIGQTGEYSVSQTGNLIGSDAGLYQYSTDGGVVWNDFLETFTLTLTEQTEVLVRSRLDSTASELGEEGFTTERKIVLVEEPQPLFVRIQTDSRAEVGFPIQLSGTARSRISGIEGNIVGEFILPSGDVVQGHEFEHVVQESDVVDGVTEYTYRAYLEGFREETLAEQTVEVRTSQYEFPQGSLSVSRFYSIAPTEIDFQILDIDSDVPGVEFSFDWRYNEDVFELTDDRTTRISLRSTTPGVHLVEVVVSDNRGNEATYGQLVTLESAPPITLSFTANPSKDNLRVPLDVNVRVSYEVHHIRDRVNTIEWLVNGEPILDSSRSEILSFDEAGDQEITVRLTTNFGQVAETSSTVSLLPNLPPVCAPTVEIESGFRVVEHNCEDPDGELVSTSYVFDGRVDNFVFRRLRFSLEDFPSLEVQIVATDDGGEQTTYTVQW